MNKYNLYIYIYIYIFIRIFVRSGFGFFPGSSDSRHFNHSGELSATFRPIQLLRDDISTYILLLQDDIWTYPVAPGHHFDVFWCSRTTFRRVLLLWNDISTKFRSVLLLQDDILAYPAAPGRHFDLSSWFRTTFRPIHCSGMTFRPILLIQADICILLLPGDISTCSATPG